MASLATMPFPYRLNPLTNIAPFSYRDGETYMSTLERLRVYVTENMTPEYNTLLASIIVDFQTGITNAETTITETSTEWDVRYAAFIANFVGEIKALNETAVAGMVPAGVVHDAIMVLIDAETVALAATLRGETTALAAALRSEADTANGELTAAQAATAGTVAGHTGQIAGKLEKGYIAAGSLEHNEDFSTRPDGNFTVSPTGQPYSFLGPTMNVAAGFATYAPSDTGGAYGSVKLEGDAVWAGGEFKFTPYTVYGGMAVFAMTEEDIRATINGGQGLPRMSAHLCISPTEITLDVLHTKGGSVTRVWTHPFDTPLLSDNATVYDSWIAVDRKTGTATVVDPYGEVHTVTHTGFKIPSPWVFFEPFRINTGVGQTLTKFARVQADSRDTSRPAVLAAIGARPRKTSVTLTAPTPSNQVLTNTPTPFWGAVQSLTFPASGKIRATLNTFVDITSVSNGAINVAVIDDAGNVMPGADLTVGTKPDHSGWLTIISEISGSPGSVFTGTVAFRTIGPGAAQVNLGKDAFSIDYTLTLSFECS